MLRHFLLFNKSYLLTGVTGVLGGIAFSILHVPVPWLLGSLSAIFIGRNIFEVTFTWRANFRNFGLVVIGYTLGLSLNKSALNIIMGHLPFMVLFTFILLFICVFTALFISKLFKLDYNTSLLASIPGGLSQILVIAEETEGINLAVVTVTQVIRLILIIVSMPLLVLLPYFQDEKDNFINIENTQLENTHLFPSVFLFVIVSFIFITVFKKLKFPTPYLLGPLLGTSFLQVLGISAPNIPFFFTNGAQILIGIHIGRMLDFSQVIYKKETLFLAFLNGIILLSASIGLSMLLVAIQPLNQATGLLSLSPGGIDQMGIIAFDIGADLSIVSGYQLFRTLSIFLIVPSIIKWLFKKNINNSIGE